MTLFDATILGVIQGLTEFVPISSSGHLIVTRELMGINDQVGLAFDAILHLATALAVFIYFRVEIINLIKTGFDWLQDNNPPAGGEKENRTLLVALILGTIPAVLAAFLFEGFIEGVLRDPLVVASALIAGSIVFWIAEQVAEKRYLLTARRGFLAGIFQAFALIPGVSRSGIVISGGLFLGLNRELATRFAFLLGFPIILGSGLKKVYDLGVGSLFGELGFPLIVGSLAALLFGYFSIGWMLKYLKNHSLTVFVVYRIILAAVIFIIVL